MVQVCASLAEPTTRSRELHGLIEAMTETGLRTAEIVTLHEEETIPTDAGAITVVPAWRWFLEDGR